jgi:hypothetical protein
MAVIVVTKEKVVVNTDNIVCGRVEKNGEFRILMKSGLENPPTMVMVTLKSKEAMEEFLNKLDLLYYQKEKI